MRKRPIQGAVRRSPTGPGIPLMVVILLTVLFPRSSLAEASGVSPPPPVIPSASLSVPSQPDISLPALSPPDISQPNISVPNTSLPDTASPTSILPATLLPQNSRPQSDSHHISENQKWSTITPNRTEAKYISETQTSDQQLMELAKLIYKEPESINSDDLKDIFGTINNEPNAILLGTEDLGNGFQAMAVKNVTTGEVIVAFRGSDTEDRYADWWGQNLSIWQQTKGIQISSAKKFVKKVMDSKKARGCKIVLTGHSLGGFHAQYIAKEFGFPAVTFNAPGLKPHPFSRTSLIGKILSLFNPNLNGWQDLGNSFGNNHNQVINYVNAGDVVGNLGVHYGKVVVINKKGNPPEERNDYLNPFKDFAGSIIGKSIITSAGEGFGKAHSLESFQGQFKNNGNIFR